MEFMFRVWMDSKHFIIPSGDGHVPHDHDIRECSASLHCSRPEAPAAKGPCDVHGMVGAVCSHCNPLRGMFMDMHGSEQFIYYLVLLVALIKACPALRDVYVDFACRLAVTWKRFLTNQASQFFQSKAEHDSAMLLRLIVNWMHGSSHNLSCQLQNNGRYKEGAGRKHGEGSEQLWSLTKVDTQ